LFVVSAVWIEQVYRVSMCNIFCLWAFYLFFEIPWRPQLGYLAS